MFFISSLMPSLLTTMKNTTSLLSNEIYLLSALAALQKVVETLPHFISPYLEGILSQVGQDNGGAQGIAYNKKLIMAFPLEVVISI